MTWLWMREEAEEEEEGLEVLGCGTRVKNEVEGFDV